MLESIKRKEVKIMIKRLLTIITFVVAIVVGSPSAFADTVSVNFEDPPYSLGSIHNQDGWMSLGSAGSGCAVYDHAVASQSSYVPFQDQSLRISNAVTSGCFGDNTFAKPLADSVGETAATAGSFSVGTKHSHFEAQFDIASTVPAAQQPGMNMSLSPDRGDGSRMSYLRFEDGALGLDVFFVDVQGTTNPANFVETQIGTGLDRSVPHTIKLVMDVVNGPSNDVVKVSIDGSVVHTGTSWENYYRFDSEASAEQSPRIVKTLIFRTGGTAVPANAGNGFFFDNLSLAAIATVPATPNPLTGTATKGYVGQSMTINWPDNASNETRYEVRYVRYFGGGYPITVVLPADSTTWTLNGLKWRDHYSFQVRACNAVGCSAYSNLVTLVIAAP